MEHLVFTQDHLKFELNITVSKLQPGAEHKRKVDGCTFIYQEMFDEEGKSFYFFDTCHSVEWKGPDLPLVQYINQFFGLGLTECTVYEKATGRQYSMAVDKRAIKLPEILEYRESCQFPGIYCKISLPKRGFDDPVRLDSNGNILPSASGSTVIPDQDHDFIF
jgi:hypothetical protein